MTFSLDARAHSEVGLVRKNNQDSAYISGHMLLVADGMGGAAAGDLASTVAVREAARTDAHYEGEQMLEALAGAMTRANDTLADLIANDPSLDGMGTTVSGALFSGTQLGMAHIGDSRGYLLRDGELTRITHDHSWVQSLIDEGKITEAEAAVHPHRNLLLRVLNGQPVHEPDYWIVDVREGDRLMLCSDGLCGLVNDARIAHLLGAGASLGARPSLDDSLSNLVAAARQAGGHDNITVVLADVVAQSEALDTAAGLMLGAAATVEVPAVPASNHGDATDPDTENATDADQLDPDSPPPGLIDPDAKEVQRYAPVGGRRRMVVPIVSTLVAVLVLGLAGVGGVAWTKTQYYVGENNNHVTIYRGIPASIGWLRLSEPFESRDTLVSDLPTYYANQVRGGMAPGPLATARQAADVLDAKAQVCIQTRRQRDATQPSTSPTPTPSTSPSATTAGTPTPLVSASAPTLFASPTPATTAEPPHSIDSEGC